MSNLNCSAKGNCCISMYKGNLIWSLIYYTPIKGLFNFIYKFRVFLSYTKRNSNAFTFFMRSAFTDINWKITICIGKTC